MFVWYYENEALKSLLILKKSSRFFQELPDFLKDESATNDIFLTKIQNEITNLNLKDWFI